MNRRVALLLLVPLGLAAALATTPAPAQSSASYRLEEHVLNAGGQPARLRITLRDDRGDAVGGVTTVDVGPGLWRQANDIFSTAGAGTVPTGYATVELESGANVWTYASVVDRLTRDPTTIPMQQGIKKQFGSDFCGK